MQHNFPVPQNKNTRPLLEKDLTDKIIGAALEVHRSQGPGLLESIYQVCLERESKLRNIPFEYLELAFYPRSSRRSTNIVRKLQQGIVECTDDQAFCNSSPLPPFQDNIQNDGFLYFL
jgi:hypothetical protein